MIISTKSKNLLLVHIPTYLTGIFIMTWGISLSVKSDLGVSPGSSIPYTMTCVWGIEVGRATILFHFMLVLLQFILLRKKFKTTNILQAVASMILGYCTTFCNWCLGFLPDPETMAEKLFLLLISCFLIAFGMFLYVETKITPFAVVGTMPVLSDLTSVPFPKMKILCDLFMAVFSLTVCIIEIGKWGSIGIGTILTAILVGTILDKITLHLGPWRKKWLQMHLIEQDE